MDWLASMTWNRSGSRSAKSRNATRVRRWKSLPAASMRSSACCSRACGAPIHIQQIRAFRQQTVRGPHAQVSDFRGRQLAAARLVRQRGIEIPVGDDHRAALQSGQNHFRDVLRAVGGEQQRLRTRGDVGTIVLIPRIHAVQQHFANRHAQCGAARLARDHAFAALRFNICAQPFDLRGLAHAVNAFKRDKKCPACLSLYRAPLPCPAIRPTAWCRTMPIVLRNIRSCDVSRAA